MPARLILIFFVPLFLVVSCSAEPETVIETVVHRATVKVEVTRLVENEVEVTREVEITREIEVPVEVTRIVEIERVITATPEPTVEPTPEPSMTATVVPAAAPSQPATPEPVQDLATTLLEQMTITRGQMQSFGGQIDAALRGDPFSCLDSAILYDVIVNTPPLDISSTSLEVQGAYGQYRASIDIFRDGAKDMTGNCREVVDGTKEGTTIPFQQWGLARQQVDQAIGTLSPAIQRLGGE